MSQVVRRCIVDEEDHPVGASLLNSGIYALNILNHPHDDFYLRVARGYIDGFSRRVIAARSTAITDTESVIWDNGGDYTFGTAAEVLSIVSDSSEDDEGGSGALTLFIEGLDKNYAYISETVTLTGTDAVTTSNMYLRFWGASVITSGTNNVLAGANVGIITITGYTSANVYGKIVAKEGQTRNGVFTVPDGKTAYIYSISFSAGQGKQCLFKIKLRNGPSSEYAFTTKYNIDLYQQPFQADVKVPYGVPERTDVALTGRTASGTVDVSGAMSVLIIDD